jgi:hypothetical protein
MARCSYCGSAVSGSRCSHCGAETLIRGDDFTIDGPSQKDVEVMRILRFWYKQEYNYV